MDKDVRLPERKVIDHRGPLSVDVSDAVYFVTIAGANRGGSDLVDAAGDILSAARFHQNSGKWHLHILLVMPDHLHMLVHVPPERTLKDVVWHWKAFLANQRGVKLQRNFFDTRIRDAAHFEEKWNYICRNPVSRGLVATPREWPHSIAFDPATGLERPHR